MKTYKELNEDLTAIILESKKVPKGSYRFALLKAKATRLHSQLLELDKSSSRFNRSVGNYEQKIA